MRAAAAAHAGTAGRGAEAAAAKRAHRTAPARSRTCRRYARPVDRHSGAGGRGRGAGAAVRRGAVCGDAARSPTGTQPSDRKSVVLGKRVSVRVDLGGLRTFKTK